MWEPDQEIHSEEPSKPWNVLTHFWDFQIIFKISAPSFGSSSKIVLIVPFFHVTSLDIRSQLLFCVLWMKPKTRAQKYSFVRSYFLRALEGLRSGQWTLETRGRWLWCQNPRHCAHRSGEGWWELRSWDLSLSHVRTYLCIILSAVLWAHHISLLMALQ